MMSCKNSKYRIKKNGSSPQFQSSKSLNCSPKAYFCPIKHPSLPNKIFRPLLIPFPPHYPYYRKYPQLYTTFSFFQSPQTKKSKKTNRNNPIKLQVLQPLQITENGWSKENIPNYFHLLLSTPRVAKKPFRSNDNMENYCRQPREHYEIWTICMHHCMQKHTYAMRVL